MTTRARAKAGFGSRCEVGEAKKTESVLEFTNSCHDCQGDMYIHIIYVPTYRIRWDDILLTP